MEIRNLKTYIEVCEKNSFTKAAQQMGYTQSTVTGQIKQLEEELGVSLFDRNGKHIKLNAMGEELLTYANRIVALEEEAKDQCSDSVTPKGLLRVGVIESVGAFLLPDILRAYMQAYPLVNIWVRTGTTREIQQMLCQNQIDLMLTLDDRVTSPDWICALERKEEIVFLCSPGHPFALRQEVPLSEVVCENMLLTERKCNYRQTYEQICNTHGFSQRSSLEIGSTNTILDFTQNNLGLSLLPAFTVQSRLAAGQLSTFSVKDVEIEMLVQLIYRKSKYCSPAMKAFINLAKESICGSSFEQSVVEESVSGS